MIEIKVDEAYAFDMLAIMELKALYKPTSQNYINMELMIQALQGQIGADLYVAIHESEPYKALFEANRTAYELVDRISAGEMIGAELVHNANMKRYKFKTKIQTIFFGKTLSEQKTV